MVLVASISAGGNILPGFTHHSRAMHASSLRLEDQDDERQPNNIQYSPACRFLFKPQETVVELMNSTVEAMHAEPKALKIGIHIRLGDAEMAGGA